MNNKHTIVIGWLYPDLMSTYGDRGNIICLQKRAQWRGIDVTILTIDQTSSVEDLNKVDLFFGGGSQDREQEIVMRDLRGKKGEKMKECIEKGIPALFVCGAPQLMGNFYEPAQGKRIQGLGIFDMKSVNPGNGSSRLIGNVIAKTSEGITIVGFENHGGRTYLGKNARPFAKVIKGNGNNGEDGTEGVVYKNAIGCYFHGPLLPKNPEVADLVVKKTLKQKYKKDIPLKALDDSLGKKARDMMLGALGIRT